MLLSISTTHRPATDLGHLLHKHPDRLSAFDLGFGTAHVAYPEASGERCTAVLLVELAPEAAGRRGAGPTSGVGRTGFALAGSVNDRAYTASSLLAVAIGRVLGSALRGASNDRPELAATPIPLEIDLPVVSVRGGPALAARLFEPLGVEVRAEAIPLDPAFPDWGDSRFFHLQLRATTTLRQLLAQLYVLLPVLDDDKHYWVERSEIDKLLRRGEGWLATHPDRELITRRYLRHQPRLTREALDRLVVADGDLVDADAADEAGAAEEAAIERPLSLNEQRLAAVVAAVEEAGARTVADVGCGEGRLIQRLLRLPAVERVTGIDVSMRALRCASERLHLDTMAPRQRARVELAQGSSVYRDDRLRGVDAITAIEVIEHLDPHRIDTFTSCLLGHPGARTVIVTTPNVEYNARFAGMAPGALRHRDHRFEWTRAEFAAWAASAASEHGYRVAHRGIGPDDPELGPPTQMAVFAR